MELTKTILDAAYNGFKAPQGREKSDWGLVWKNLTPEQIARYYVELVAFGIEPMFRALGIVPPIVKAAILMHCRLDFAYFNFLNSIPEDRIHPNMYESTCLRSNVKRYLNNLNVEDAEAFIWEGYSHDFAFANTSAKIVFINRYVALPQIGLHLICHEIMHILADKGTVTKMWNGNSDFQDEAVNEYFARLATYFYINSQEDEREDRCKIAGLTCFNDDLFNNSNVHDDQLGLYGNLMAKDKHLQCHANWARKNDEYSVQYIKDLANYYFKGGTDPLL